VDKCGEGGILSAGIRLGADSHVTYGEMFLFTYPTLQGCLQICLDCISRVHQSDGAVQAVTPSHNMSTSVVRKRVYGLLLSLVALQWDRNMDAGVVAALPCHCT
jgi:hypothetical protein